MFESIIGLIGVLMGWLLNYFSQCGRIIISNYKCTFNATHDLLKIKVSAKNSDREEVNEPGYVYSCTLYIELVNLADYDKFLRDIRLKIGRIELNPKIYEYDSQGYSQDTINNSLLLKPKEYKKCELHIPIEDILNIKNELYKVKIIYKQGGYTRRSKNVCKYNFINELDTYCKVNNKIRP